MQGIGTMISVKRIYEDPSGDDGFRILVDRLWPRGLKKENVAIDLWLKDIAPSEELRKWFSHDPQKWNEFKKRYFAELDAKPDIVGRIKDAGDNVTLLFGAKDKEHNNAVALRDYIMMRMPGGRPKMNKGE
jgi:uncharacterized protein YeaO (DUF488 family)